MKKLVTLLILSSVFLLANTQTINLNLKVFIEGPYYNEQMTPFLNVLGHLPTNQPYNSNPWNYFGNETVSSLPSANIVDWVLVDILKPHTDNDQIKFELMGRRAGFLFQDGFIKDIDGISNLTVHLNLNSEFYVRIHHRNHLSVMSAFPLVDSSGVFVYDFTFPADQAMGGSLSQKQLSSFIWGMIAADANASGQIDNRDKNNVWLPQQNLTGYYEGDFNMDTQVDMDDKAVKWEPNAGKNTYPIKDTIVGGLPEIITDTVSDITGTTATGGGNVISENGYNVLARGVCWSIAQNPTISDAHTIDGNGPGIFISQITELTTVTSYYVRAYATNSFGTAYGNEILFNTTWEPCQTHPTIDYEGQVYNTVQIGSQCWFKENLNVGIQGTQINNGIIEKNCYDNNPDNCITYGGLYNWYEMMHYNPLEGSQGICPSGWHIPNQNDWSVLINYLGGYEIAGSKLKEEGTLHWAPPNSDATNESGFTAIPMYGNSGEANFWTSSQEFNPQKDFFNSLYVGVNNYDGYINLEYGSNYWTKSVRCVKNINLAPLQPRDPTPINNAPNQSRYTYLSWSCNDPEDDPISYDVYFDTINPPLLVSSGQSETVYYTNEILLPGATYYWSIIAKDSNDFATIGPVWSFTTQMDGLPIVSTDMVSDIGITTATGGGIVIEQGISPVVSRGVCWSLSPNPTFEDSVSVNGSGIGNFVNQITGLFPSSSYYIRAFASNSEGTGYGTQLVFSTSWEYCPGIPEVNYEGQTYNTVKIGSQCWLKENLNVGIPSMPGNNGVIEKYCYQQNPDNCDIYGGLYQWNEMMQYTIEEEGQGICPMGWHIPGNTEFQTLIDFLGGEEIAGSKMKETGTLHWSPPNSNATNESGFTGLPGGYLHAAIDDWSGLNSIGVFWSSSIGVEKYFGELVNTNFNIFFGFHMGAASVRCIKNNDQSPNQPTNPIPGPIPSSSDPKGR